MSDVSPKLRAEVVSRAGIVVNTVSFHKSAKKPHSTSITSCRARLKDRPTPIILPSHVFLVHFGSGPGRRRSIRNQVRRCRSSTHERRLGQIISPGMVHESYRGQQPVEQPWPRSCSIGPSFWPFAKKRPSAVATHPTDPHFSSFWAARMRILLIIMRMCGGIGGTIIA